ncbi:hypothetical protein KSP39_PZI016625 [Platanthera zijinensis]|uniref:Signal recognition particle receptor alpha subunit n=1 Tax=Platanthera zijinensis TaxID=2320716 RepID=A0AAP0B603_9ASPA
MLEQLLIFTRGGLILWTCKELGNALRGSPIDALIRSCLLEERSADGVFNYDAPGAAAYTLKWTFHNELGLVFVAIYQRILHLLYLDELLYAMRQEFSHIYDPKRTAYDEFDEIFRQLHMEAEARAEEMRKLKQAGKAAPLLGKKQLQGPSQRGVQHGGRKQKSGSNIGSATDEDGDDSEKHLELVNNSSNGHQTGTKESIARKGKENGPPESGAFDVNKLQKLRAKGSKKNASAVVSKASKEEPKKNVKMNRVWGDSPPSESKLDFTNPGDKSGDGVLEVVSTDQGDSMMDKEEIVSSESEDEEDDKFEGAKSSAKKGWFSSMFQSISGNSVLEKSDLQPALKALKDRLMTKNVAEEIAEKLCESVAASLERKEIGIIHKNFFNCPGSNGRGFASHFDSEAIY